MTDDEERWIEAVTVERMYGDQAPLHIAKVIGALALSGDAAGIRRWREIAARLDQLLRDHSRIN